MQEEPFRLLLWGPGSIEVGALSYSAGLSVQSGRRPCRTLCTAHILNTTNVLHYDVTRNVNSRSGGREVLGVPSRVVVQERDETRNRGRYHRCPSMY